MLAISDEAKTVLKTTLDEVNTQTGSDDVFRLEEAEDGLSLKLGSVEEGDEVYELDGKAVLAASPELVGQLAGTLDTEESDQGVTLVMKDE